MKATVYGIGWIATAGCAIITLLANFSYGLHVTTGPERWVIAFGGAFLDCLKTVLPIALGTVLVGRITPGAFARLFVGVCFWALAVVWSLACALQLYEASRVEKVGTVAAGKQSYKQHSENKTAAEAKIAALEKARTAEIVEADLKAGRVDRLWTRSKECGDATATESREFCKRMAALEGEKATALTASELKVQLAGWREKLSRAERGMDGANLAEILTAADPGLEGLARLLGWEPDILRHRLAFFIALLLDLGGGLGGWLLTGGHLPKWRRKGDPPEIDDMPAAKQEAAPEAPPEPKPLTPAALWAAEGIAGRKDAWVPSSEAREAFNAWAAIHGHAALNKTAFGKEMTLLGFKRDKRGGVQIYVDVALTAKSKPATGIRLAVSN